MRERGRCGSGLRISVPDPGLELGLHKDWEACLHAARVDPSLSGSFQSLALARGLPATTVGVLLEDRWALGRSGPLSRLLPAGSVTSEAEFLAASLNLSRSVLSIARHGPP